MTSKWNLYLRGNKSSTGVQKLFKRIVPPKRNTPKVTCLLWDHQKPNYRRNGIWSCLGLWPDLRGHGLTWNLKFIHQPLRLVMSNTFFFPRSSSSIRGQTARGSCRNNPLVLWKDTKFDVPARVNTTLPQNVLWYSSENIHNENLFSLNLDDSAQIL